MATKERFIILSGTDWRGDPCYGLYDCKLRMTMGMRVTSKEQGAVKAAALNHADRVRVDIPLNKMIEDSDCEMDDPTDRYYSHS